MHQVRRRRKGHKYKGVTTAPRGFRVMIQRRVKGRSTVLYSAYFDSALAAAKAYDAEARRIFGKRARLNFPKGGELRA